VTPVDKLYILTREDLPLGLAAAQMVHVAIDWALDRREEALAFRAASNTVVLVTVPDQEALVEKHETVADTVSTMFRDPDVGDKEATAILLDPSQASKRHCRGLPLFGG
jgi:lactam utilization protein B